MAFLEFSNVGISAMSAAVPRQVVNNYAYKTDVFGAEAVRELVDKIGIRERRFAPEGMCASDMCFAAAEKIFADTKINREEIDLLIFVSETPDYKFPQTALLLQDRLGLPKSTIAFDINMGCSAVLYGLSVVYGLMQGSSLRKALLLFGDTNSRIYSPNDRASAFIFGDAATAFLIEQGTQFGSSLFSINSDGAKHDYIMVPAGASRMPSSPETLQQSVIDEHGNMRSLEQAWMKGGDVFQLVISTVPKDVRNTLARASLEINDIDYFVFHQANAFMNDHVAKKLKLPPERVPTTIEHFGNTGGVSVPLTMALELQNACHHSTRPLRLLLSAFGIGMTWGSALIELHNCRVSDLIEL